MLSSWVNVELLANPVNWVIVALVLIFGAFAIMFLAQNMGALTPSLVVKSTPSS